MLKRYFNKLYKSFTALYLYRNYLLIYPNFYKLLN